MKQSSSQSGFSGVRRSLRTRGRKPLDVQGGFRLLRAGPERLRFKVMQDIIAEVRGLSRSEIVRLRKRSSVLRRILKKLADNPDAKIRLIVEEPASSEQDDRQGQITETLQGEALQEIETAEQRQDLDQVLSDARARGSELIGAVVQQPDMLSAEDMARHMGTTRDTVNRRRKDGRLLGLEGAKRGYRYPAWQLDDSGRPFEVLPKLLEAAGDPWAAYRALTELHPEMGNISGIDAIRQGRASELVELVEHFGETFG